MADTPIDEPIPDPTTPGQHGSNFNAPYDSLVAGRVAPGTLEAVRQAIMVARERRRRANGLSGTLRSVGTHGQLPQADTPIDEPSGLLGPGAELVMEGLRRGLTDSSQFGIETAAPVLGAARMGLSMIPHNSVTDPILEHLSPEESASNAVGFTNPAINPQDTAGRDILSASRFLGGSIVPEATIARVGANVARRVAEGVAESSLTRFERMALSYVRQPGRTIAANLTGAGGSVAGGHAAAAINPALEPVGQLVGGLVGGGVPFLGRGHGPRTIRGFTEGEDGVWRDAQGRSADDSIGGHWRDPEGRTVEEVQADFDKTAQGYADDIRNAYDGVADAVSPSNPHVSTEDVTPASGPRHDPVTRQPHVDDPVAPYRDQALREHAAAHDLTPAEAADMYWTDENPKFTASVRDRANELYQKSVVDAHAPPSPIPESRDSIHNRTREFDSMPYPEDTFHEDVSGTDAAPLPPELPREHGPLRVEADPKDPTGNGHYFTFKTDTHEVNGYLTYEDGNLFVDTIMGNKDGHVLTGNGIGPSAVREFLRHIRAAFPDATSIEGIRITGARKGKGAERQATTVNLPDEPVIDPDGVYSAEYDGAGGQAPPEPPSGGGGRGGDEPPPEEPPPPGDDGEPPHPSDNVVKRLTAALNSAGRVSKDQEALRRVERAQRVAKAAAARDTVGGEEGVHAALSELKGEMPKLDFEGVRDQFTPEETKSLFTRIRDTSKLRFFEQLRAALGLKKLLDGQLPNASELALLGRVFPKDFISAALRNRSLMTKIRDAATNALNIPRALMSSVDLSAPFRQGLFLVGRKEFYKAWPTMFRQFAKGFAKDDHAFESFMDDIRAMPNYELMDEAKVFFGGVDHNLSTREESFMSPYAEKIPVLGRLVKASERAYTAFLNKLRADTANSLIELHRSLGIEPGAKELESIGRFVNSATGRGNLGRLNSSAPLLNAAFFSPRLIKSRMDMLNPVFYATLSPVVRREAIKSLLSLGAIATTVLGLAAAGGMRVETDMRSSDFGKIRNGNVRYDILGGFGQYLTLGARLWTNQTKSLDGQVSDLGGRYGARTRLDTLANFGRNKLAPIPSFVADYLAGKDATGQPFSLGHATLSRLIPLYVQDIVSVMQDKGPTGAAQSLPGMFGVGIQTIPPSHAIDHLGRHVADLPQTEADPAALEINRLNTNPNSQLIGTPRRTNVLVGDTRRNLTDEEYQTYQETSGRYIHQDLIGEMATPEWRRMSDDEKRQTIRDIVRDQRANARDELATPDTPMSVPTASVNDEPIDAPTGSDTGVSGPAGREFSAAAVVSSLFPGIHVTQEHRDPNSRLGRANPDSWHNRGRQAVDVRPIRNMNFADYVDTVRRAGYRIIEQKDEVHNPSRWATGPHWHLVIGEPGHRVTIGVRG